MKRLPMLPPLLLSATVASNLVVRSLLAAQAWPQPPVLLAVGLALAQTALAAVWLLAEERRVLLSRVGAMLLLTASLCFWADTLTLVTPAAAEYWLLLLGLHATLVGGGSLVMSRVKQLFGQPREPAFASGSQRQFSLGAMLTVMTITALLLGGARAATPEEYGIASLLGFCAITATLALVAFSRVASILSPVAVLAGAALLGMTGQATADAWSWGMLLVVQQSYLLLAGAILRMEAATPTDQGIQSEAFSPAAPEASRLALMRT